MQIQARPLEIWPRPLTKSRRRSPFKTSWDKTVRNLRYELARLEATAVILRLAVREADISVTTGLPRADRPPAHPGVIIAADTKFGALQWLCDEFTSWTANVHAIALTLKRLRLADLYGVTRSGEQYKGWKMLPGPITASADAPTMTMEAAARFVANYTNFAPADVLAKRAIWEKANRAVAKRLHPDVPGHDAANWKMYQDAAALLNHYHARR